MIYVMRRANLLANREGVGYRASHLVVVGLLDLADHAGEL